MRTTSLLLASLVVGCGGAVDATRIEELRVVAAVADPPQVAPGQPYTLDVTLADPEELGGDWRIWTCIPSEEEQEPYLQGQPALEPGCTSVEGRVGDDDPAMALVGLPFPVWMMACNPDRCDLPGASDEQLQDPDAWLEELPLSGVAVATRFPRLLGEGEVPGENPRVVDVRGLTDTVEPEAELTLGFDVPGAEAAFGYATGGGFTRARYDVGDAGNTELVWVAPEERGEVTLYVVFDDELGGTAVWSETLAVLGDAR